jgi:hypothetical protein
MTTTEIIAVVGLIAGTAIQLLALLIAVTRILRASTDAEVRSAERFIRLETKTERIELDVQNLFVATSKRRTDS